MSRTRELVFDPEALSAVQCEGDACVVCHKRWPRPRVRVGRLPDGSGVFACDECALALPPLHWAGTGTGAGRSLNGSARDTAPYR
ncbi:hypothetical protein [Thermomonospora sp. CIF 1]|uniref:hypothetical protein n=1 Tax=Thermomonospora sp. CIF 1 TaxID=1916083 RepID=UPI000CBCB317|nr:hypothetical protein [Thermomonospora sp. CIF 1]PKK13112.1 MAG: hypothetical protein BUE48_016545 [Thermomonospora sp. CIF 1]